MGAWGADSFENDDAMDWLGDFCDDPEEAFILAALRRVADAGEGEYLEAPECSASVAAAEVVAALKGEARYVPEDVRGCLASSNIKPDGELIEAALKALARVRTDSELKELWDEAANAADWHEALGDLESRLKH